MSNQIPEKVTEGLEEGYGVVSSGLCPLVG